MSIALGSFDIFSDLLNLCINTSVNIINGKGIRGSTCVKPSAKDWSFNAKIWKIPKKYAPKDARIGFHPPKITIAKHIHP